MTDGTARDDDTTAALKARRRAKPRATGSEQSAAIEPAASKPTPPGPAPVDSSIGVPATGTASSGISHHSLGGPATLVGSFTSEGVAYGSAGDYVVTTAPGYYSVYPRGAMQPSTFQVWNKGQQVRRDVFERYGGANAASRPQDAQPINEPGGGLVVSH